MQKPSMLPDVITAEEAAKYLRLSKATILRLAHKDLIAGVRIGRQWRFSRATILELMSRPELMKKAGYGA